MQGAPPSPPVDRDAASLALRDAFKDVQLALRRLKAREPRGTGTTFARVALLRRLAQHGELPASRLAALAELSPPTVTRMLDELEAHGLVERVRDADDRRVVRARLTDAGRAEAEAFDARLAAAWQAALADLDAAELDAGLRVLARIRAVFDGL